MKMARTGVKKVSLTLLFIVLSMFGLTNARRFSKDKDAVRLSDINALTFHKDGQTTHRRVSALPQLVCTAGSGCRHYEPESVRCTNSGSSYDVSSVEWTCKASLPPEFKLGSTEVVCEGYDNPDDEFVLKGSCALEYRLLLTDLGAEKFGSGGLGSKLTGNVEDMDLAALLSAALFWCIFIGISGWILYALSKAVFRAASNRRGPRPDNRRGWGGGWGDDDDDPPPPYSPYRDNSSSPRTNKPRASKSSQAGSSRASSSRNTGSQQSQQRPWWQYVGAGTAAGAAAGYLAGSSRNAQRERERAEQERRMGSGRQGSWFGGPSTRTPSGAGSGGSSSPSVSGTRYESTGFGGTRRR